MTTRVITGSKQEIAGAIAGLSGDVREVIVFVDEPSNAAAPSNGSTQDIFAEMQSLMSAAENVNDARDAIYTPSERE